MTHLWEVKIADANDTFTIKTNGHSIDQAVSKAKRMMRQAGRLGYPTNGHSKVLAISYAGTLDL